MDYDRKETILNYIMLFGILIFLLAGVFFMVYYFNHKSNECVRDPLVYAAKQLEEEVGFEFVGSGFFLTPVNIKSPTITFNSTSKTVK